ncbi:MAG TPA: LysE family transporter [Puia sp.]|jgi:threonine/homoserine/homoserine lactone efflux protein|nr:LysE family transporter [Puia sp.]
MLQDILKGLALGFVLVLSVGPIIFTIIKQSLSNGYKGGLSFVAGVWLSDIILVTLSNAFTALVAELLEHKREIGIGGSIFLIAMGVFFVFFKKVHLTNTANGEASRFRKRDMAKIFASGFIINTLNPGVIIFWLGNATVLSITHTFKQRIIIFSVCLIVNMAADVGKVMMAGKLGKRLTLHNLSIINKISGLILIGFGIVLAWGVIFITHKS